jgi:ribulose kinase
MCGGGARNALSLREHADAIGCDIHLAAEHEAVALGAAILAATASGAFADIPSAAAAMARPGAVVRANPARRAFHDAKYAVFHTLATDWQRYRDMMGA